MGRGNRPLFTLWLLNHAEQRIVMLLVFRNLPLKLSLTIISGYQKCTFDI